MRRLLEGRRLFQCGYPKVRRLLDEIRYLYQSGFTNVMIFINVMQGWETSKNSGFPEILFRSMSLPDFFFFFNWLLVDNIKKSRSLSFIIYVLFWMFCVFLYSIIRSYHTGGLFNFNRLFTKTSISRDHQHYLI